MSEIELCDLLAEKCAIWLQDVKIKSKKSDELTTPSIVKYFFDFRTTPTFKGGKQISGDSDPNFPALLIRPKSGSEENDSNYPLAKCSIELFAFTENDIVQDMVEDAMLMMRIIRKNLLATPDLNGYRMELPCNWSIFDNSQAPTWACSLTTHWEYHSTNEVLRKS